MKNKYMPFTLPGMAFFVITLVILIRSLANRNAYEIILSLAALAFWVVLGLAGTWAVRRLDALEPHWKIPQPLTAASREEWLVACPASGIPWFFRLHFLVKGNFFPQGSPDGCRVFTETSLSRKTAMGSSVKSNIAHGRGAPLSLCFPLGGLFRGECSCRLRDIFGLFSFPCGVNRERVLNVRSAPCDLRALQIKAQSGAEDRRSRNASDEERYYMREYTPGDRFRDINWKSSERIDTLITRISPDNQEKITRIEVYFRNYGPVVHGVSAVHGSKIKNQSAKAGGPSIGDLWLLDRAKARLAWFLRKAKEEKASYVFHVRSAGRSWELKDDEEIDAFLEEFAVIPFSPAQNEDPASLAEGELYVFSTACDRALPSFLLAYQGKPLSLFLTLNALKEKTSEGKKPPEKSEPDRLFIRDFFSGGFAPPVNWLLPRKEHQLKVNGSLMIDYAETRL